jgi:hypothetical protein
MGVDPQFVRSLPAPGLGEYRLWWYRRQGEWVNLKLTLFPPPKGKGRTHTKFNWWLGWHCTEQRMRECRDLQLLQQHRPKIYQWVITVCKNRWPRQHERSGAECQRL